MKDVVFAFFIVTGVTALIFALLFIGSLNSV